MNVNPKQFKVPTLPKNALFLQMQFLGDKTSEILTQCLRNAVKRAFPAAESRCVFKTTPPLRSGVKDKLSNFASSMCIYQFNCSCGPSYIGRTIRSVCHRISKHHPAKWLSSKGQTKSIRSAIISHLFY
uniref:Uncharacterized protein n=1 Tax=Trichobilharzia regenti TaxID=157069 RepID=A0AA85KRA7_TRIRE|nr:unnamed protein product [Trichobilharzia regenti]